MHTVRWNDTTGQFEIVTLGSPDENGNRPVTGTVHVFLPDTANATACAAYDRWRETGELPDGVTTA